MVHMLGYNEQTRGTERSKKRNEVSLCDAKMKDPMSERSPGKSLRAGEPVLVVTKPGTKRTRQSDKEEQLPVSQFETNSGVKFLRGLSAAICSVALLCVMESPAQAQSALTRHVRESVTNGQAQFLNPMPPAQS